MNQSEATILLLGATVMGFFVAGLFFLRFWRDTSDRLFAMFAFGFWTLALNWAMLAVIHPSSETRHQVYLIRLIGFALIIGGIVDKNRTDRRP